MMRIRILSRGFVDVVLTAAVMALAVIVIWVSATGLEQISVLLFAVGAALGVLLIGIGWAMERRRRNCAASPVVLAAFVVLVMIVSVAWTQWPLRFAYSLSRPALDAAATRIQGGEQLQMPKRIRSFVIRETEILPSSAVCLWTDLNPAGRTGFVKCPKENLPFNLWSHVAMDDEWQLIAED